jgi:hypothetical protein
MKNVSPRYPTYVIHEGYDRELALQSVGDGWASLVNEVFDMMSTMKTSVKIIQVKEKWGGLRIYTDAMHGVLDKRIIDVEKRSFEICETCGNPGALRSGGWYQTLCDVHGGNKPIVKNPV